jgi:Zn-finger nucleic acid-binding protein
MTPLACGNCGQAMTKLTLAGHYGQRVQLDLCAPCHLVWFDPVESARLTGPGLLALISEMARAQSFAHTTARPDMHCPHCRGSLRTVHNRTRWGRSLQLECAAGHGTWQTFGEFLNEKGLLRPMSGIDRARALQQQGTLHCVNCGGEIGADDEACSWCGTVPALVDVARLAAALDPEAATAGHQVHRTAVRRGSLQCAACGAAQPAEGGWQCVSCKVTLTAPDLEQAVRLVSAIGPALQAHAERPAAHVVKRRLDAQQPALDRQREAAARMQAEAEARMGHHRPWPQEQRSSPLTALPEKLVWALGALLALLLSWLFD